MTLDIIPPSISTRILNTIQGKIRSLRKKNSSPLGEAINAKNRAEKEWINARKNRPRKAVKEAKKRLDYWTRKVDELKKSNK